MKLDTKEHDNPLVSIIVITYNSAKYVLETLESAKTQTYQNIELIVSDDCSTDDTVEICRRWIEENKGRFVKAKIVTVDQNTGVSGNCNRGVKSAQGEWIKFIAGDDTLKEEALEKYIEYLKTHCDIEVLHCDCDLYDNKINSTSFIRQTNGKILLFNNPMIRSNHQYSLILRESPIYAPTTILKRNIINKYKFDEEIRNIEDKPLWITLTRNNIKLNFIPISLVNYRIHDLSIQKAFNEIYSAYKYSNWKMYKKYIHDELYMIEQFSNRLDFFRISLLIKFGINNSNNRIHRYVDLFTKKPFLLIKQYFNHYIHTKIQKDINQNTLNKKIE
jgi:alpha-1,3-rhamnosyltransferase